MSYNKAILDAAGVHLGLTEWAGAKHNPVIVEMAAAVGHAWVEDDETPWCASFVGSVLGGLGLPHSGGLNARSYEDYGQAVESHKAQPGDIVVLWRGSPDSWMGHVAFFVRYDGNKVILRGGNQGNKVSDAAYDRDKIVAVRRADGVVARGVRPVLRMGDRGQFVRDLQTQLHDLGYTLGKIDGHFGTRTLGALTSFQADNDLKADGVVGDRTWRALVLAHEREDRDVKMEDLKGKSRTITEAEKGKQTAKIGGGAAIVGVVAAQADEVTQVVKQAENLIEVLGGIAPSVLIAIVVAGVAWYAYGYFKRIQDIRLDDARTGANSRV